MSANSGVIDFKKDRESYGERTPWSGEETAALVVGAESVIEREISKSILKKGAKTESQRLKLGETLVEQGSEDRELFLWMDGMLDVKVDGETVARASTPCNVIIVPGVSISEEALAEVTKSRR